MPSVNPINVRTADNLPVVNVYADSTVTVDPTAVAERDSLVAQWVREQYVMSIESSQGANQTYQIFRQISDRPVLAGVYGLGLLALLLLLYRVVDGRLKHYAATVGASLVGLIVSVGFYNQSPAAGDDRLTKFALCAYGTIFALLILCALWHRLDFRRLFVGGVSRRTGTVIGIGAVCVLIVMALINVSIGYSVDTRERVDWFFVTVLTAAGATFFVTFVKFFRYAVGIFTRRRRRGALYERQVRHMMLTAALSAFFLGFGVYFIGMYTMGTQKSVLAMLFRPALAASKMFFLGDSVGDLSYVLRCSGAFMGVNTLARLYAFAVSASAVIWILGARLQSVMALRRVVPEGRPVYVFWGINGRSEAFTADILSSHRADEPEPMIIWIEPQDERQPDKPRMVSVETFVSFFAKGREAYNRAAEAGALLLTCSNTMPEPDDTLDSLGLKSLRRVVKGRPQSLSVFLLSDDGDANLAVGRRVASIISSHGVTAECHVYCHSHTDHDSMILPFDAPEGVEMHLLDSAAMAAKSLRAGAAAGRPETLPLSYMTVGDDASVSGHFTSLIVGMGETGVETLKFLYEYSAYAGSDGRQAATHHYCVDRDIEGRRCEITLAMPAVMKSGRVSLLGLDIGTSAFWEWLGERIDEIDYAVIACGDDRLNRDVAVRLFDFAIGRRTTSRPMQIFVRNYSEAERRECERVFEFYNNRESRCRVRIGVFGFDNEVFTKALVCDEMPLRRAMEFYNTYEGADRTVDREALWRKRHKALRTPGADLYLIRDIRRKESQDLTNSDHAAAKIILAGDLADRLLDYARRRGAGFMTASDVREALAAMAADDPSVGRRLERMAQTEHLRWVASHEAMGYVYGPDKDTRLRTHNCIIGWDKLTDSYRDYDRRVVFTTLALWVNERLGR